MPPSGKKESENSSSGDRSIVGLPSPLSRDDRKLHRATTLQFVGLLLVIPVWLGVLMPVTIVYQIVARLLRMVGIIGKKSRPVMMDTGVSVAPEHITPRSERQYDLVVLGVTGFTGRLAARHLAQEYSQQPKTYFYL